MNFKACRQHTWIVTLLYVGHCFCAVTLTQSSTNVDKGSSLNIIATFDEASLSWTYKGGTPLSTCSFALNDCFPRQEENMMFTVSSTTNTSTLSIASLNCSINTAVYVASTDSLLTDTVNIDVTTPVSSRVSTTVLTAIKVPSQDLLVEVKCVYPRSTITANFTISRSGEPDDILFPDSIQTSTSSSGCECFEDTYVVKKTITALQYPNEVVQVQANIGQLSPLVIGDVNFTAGPTTQTSIVFLTESIPTTNYNNEYSNTNLLLTSEIVTPTSSISEMLSSINTISAITTTNSLGKDTTHFVNAEYISSTLLSMSSEHSLDHINSSEINYITIKHTPSMLLTSPDLHTETTLSFDTSTAIPMSNLFVSSLDSFSSEQHFLFSQTSFLETSDTKSTTMVSITDVLSDSSSTFTKLPVVFLTSMSISASSVRFYSTPLSTFAVANSTNELISSTVKSTDLIVNSISVLTYRTTTIYLLTSDISNSGIVSETELTDTESYLLMSETYLTNDQNVISNSVPKATHSYVSSEFLSQIQRAGQTIISIDTSMHATDSGGTDNTHYSMVLQTTVSVALMSSEHSFLFGITKFFSTIPLSVMTLKTSRLESYMYKSSMKDDIITTEVHNLGYLSSISLNLSKSIGSSISMKTSNSLMSTSVFASYPTTTTTETRIFMSGFLQSSFYPTEQDFSLRTTEDYVTTMQPTNSFLVPSSEKNPSTFSSKMITTASGTKSSVHTIHNPDMLTMQNNSLMRTIVDQSDLRTTLFTSTSAFEHQLNSSMSNHSFSRTIDVTSIITAQSTIRNSFSSLIYSSDSYNVVLSTSTPFLYATSSADFKSTTIHSTSNTVAGISDTTKSAIFITIVSVVVIIIIVFSSIMLLSRVTFERKTVNVSLSNEGQFPYMKRAIYPRFSDSLSSYMTSPYERNWHEV